MYRQFSPLSFKYYQVLLSVYVVCFVVLADNLMHCLVYDTAVCLLGFFLYLLVIHLQLLIHFYSIFVSFLRLKKISVRNNI